MKSHQVASRLLFKRNCVFEWNYLESYKQRNQLPLCQWLSTRGNFASPHPSSYLAMSRDISHCQNLGGAGRCAQELLASSSAAQHLQGRGQPPSGEKRTVISPECQLCRGSSALLYVLQGMELPGALSARTDFGVGVWAGR